MQLNPAISAPQVLKPLPLITPTVQASIAPAVVAQQQAAPTVRTQTTQAAQATGRSDGSRGTQTSTTGGQSVDTAANVLNARTNGVSGGRRRGSTLDVSV